MATGDIGAIIDTLIVDAEGYTGCIETPWPGIGVIVDQNGGGPHQLRISTFTVDAAGNIGGALIDQITPVDAAAVSGVLKIADGIIAIFYTNHAPAWDLRCSTVGIGAAGNITGIINTLILDGGLLSYARSQIKHVSGTVYVGGYQTALNTLGIVTWNIYADGTMDAAPLSVGAFGVALGNLGCDVWYVAGNVWASINTQGAVNATVRTFTIAPVTGVISVAIDTWDLGGIGDTPSGIAWSGTVQLVIPGALSCGGVGGMGTFHISAAGVITPVFIDTMVHVGGAWTIGKIGTTVVELTYFDGGGGGSFLETIQVDLIGNIGPQIDVQNFGGAFGGYPKVIRVTGNTYLLSCTTAPTNDLVVKTVSMETVALAIVTTVTAVVYYGQAILRGVLNADGGEPCTCGFEWGLTPALGTTVTLPGTLATGAVFSSLLAGLTGVTTYYFRAFATNVAGTVYGAIRSFIHGTFDRNRAYALSREEV